MTTVQRFTIADGDAGVAQTVDRIADLIRESIATPIVRQCATSLVANLGPNDFAGQIYAIREFLQQNVRFLRDPAGVELLHTPEWMLSEITRAGAAYVDCDDVAILGGALAGAIGFRVCLVTVAFLDSRNPSAYTPLSHIWTAVTAPVAFRDSEGKQIWIELDTTRPMQDLPLHAISRKNVTPVII